MRLRLALVGVSVLIAVAGPAHAVPDTDTDTQFRDSLTAAGITYRDPDEVVSTAKNVCRLISNSQAAPQVVTILRARNPELTPELAEKFVGIAVRSYCPDQMAHGDSGE